ncbi:type VII secretion protein EccCb [Mycolicibacter sinensis]|uniref:Type VII secretion protein EccCb n=1 Tax=Mycolicibacter sinensis (strain JDM601) TaxID=875328 RepID=A0A1A2XHC5_MYCSD|nr:type VII secretion protein EccCb [Mycolicibacter sinensis]OBI24296.1 type VII secretion protein EccCb [Mycolicibacter sinensis]
MVQVSGTVREGLRFAATPDVMPLWEAEALARSLARFTPTDDAERLLAKRADEVRAGNDFLEAHGIFDARTWDPTIAWGQVTPAERLKIPIGKTPSGQVMYLDIKEGAENGDGPHGSMTGQTGSGKSEHLITCVLGWAAKFPPEMVQILLGDFKGESAFAGLEDLPHVQGIVSNLEKSAHRLDRFELMLRGELARRQEILNKHGFKGVREYEAARAAGRDDLEPLGALILVLDEFSQLLQLRPDMAKVMDETARLGRSLWIHILNASQRQDVGKMSGMIAQQTYAIGLKVKNAGESRAAIGSARAWEDLKNAPQGSAFFVNGDGEHTRYRSFYVSGPFTPPKLNASERDRIEGHYLPAARFGAEVAAMPDTVQEETDDTADDFDDATPGAEAATVMSVMVDRLREAGATRPRHRLWLPALEETTALPIDEVIEEFWGRPWDQFTPDAGLVVPYGREDDPYRHAQDVVSVGLADTNLGLAGAPQSGKSTALRTVMMALAMTHSPERVQFYGLDFGGGKLRSLSALPHVCGIAAHGDDEKIRRVVSEVERIVRFRNRTWAAWGDNGIDLSTFRANKFGPKRAEVPDDGHGDVFLVVDNVQGLKIQQDLFDVHERLNALIEGALNFGVHVIIANDQWITIKSEQKLTTKIELRMADSIDSKMGDREAAKHVPEDQKGRGLVKGGKHMLCAVPYLTQFAENSSEVAATEATAALVAQRWADLGYASAPKLQQLPAEIAYTALPPAEPGFLKFGIGERDMTTVGLDLRQTPHAYCVGTTRSGRTMFLKTICAAIMETYTPEQAQVIQFDPDLSLADSIDDRYRVVYQTTISGITAAATEMAKKLGERRPPAHLTPQEQAAWNPVRPKWFIIVDDLNLLTPSGSNQSALQPLVSAIETARKLDLHLIVASSSENWFARGRQNKVVQAMDTGGASVVVLDGNKQEVIVDQVRPAARIPGRAEFYSRKGGTQLVHVALPPGWTPPRDQGI